MNRRRLLAAVPAGAFALGLVREADAAGTIEEIDVTDPRWGADPTGNRDSTAAFEGAGAYAYSLVSGGRVRGARVTMPRGAYKVSSFVYYPLIQYVGEGARLTMLWQPAGVADVIAKPKYPRDNSNRTWYPKLREFCLDGVWNTSNQGGLLVANCFRGFYEELYITGTRGPAIRGVGGAAMGDTMHNVISRCTVENILSGGAFLFDSDPVSGSGADATIVRDFLFNSAHADYFVKGVNSLGKQRAYGPSSMVFDGTSAIAVPGGSLFTWIDVDGHYWKFLGNRFELMNGTAEVQIRPSASSTRFYGDEFPTYGQPVLTWNDKGYDTRTYGVITKTPVPGDR